MMKVYIVDDSKVIRDRLSRELKERLGTTQIKEAEGADQVDINPGGNSPDVMIVDIHLKKGSGFDVLRSVKNAGINPLVIVLTNHAVAPYKQRAFDLGADHFFDKSHEFNKAIEAIENYASRS